ncbi:MAG: ferredoxin family protein [Anaerolineales bacterium]
MNANPTFWSALAQHWQIARRLRNLEIQFDPEKCIGAWQCYEVCPIGCWTPDYGQRKVVFHDAARCIACGACVMQCPEDAIKLD